MNHDKHTFVYVVIVILQLNCYVLFYLPFKYIEIFLLFPFINYFFIYFTSGSHYPLLPLLQSSLPPCFPSDPLHPLLLCFSSESGRPSKGVNKAWHI